MDISLFKNVSAVTSPENFYIMDYLEKIRDGEWEDIVMHCRLIKDKKERDLFKQTMPTATMSGIFDYRSDARLIRHSGYIAMDLDHVENINVVKQALMQDKYVCAAYMSTSGTGLRVLFRINPTRHKDAFRGLCKYIYENYGVPADINGVNISKPYIVSFDPFIYINFNDRVPEFRQYIVEKAPTKKMSDFVYVPSDLESIIKQIIGRGVNICEDYSDWLKVGFALSSALGEDGRLYFHEISKFSSKYRPSTADQQYTSCLKAKNSGVGISSLYYLAKTNGISVVSEQTRKIVRTTKNGKRAGLSKAQIIENLEKFENIQNADGVVDKVFESPHINSDEDDEEMMLQQLEMFISNNYDLRMNEVTGYLEQHGMILSQSYLNTIFIAAKKLIPKLDYQLMMRLLKSDFVENYNPFFKFLGSDGIAKELPAIPIETDRVFESPLIDKLAESIENDNPAFTAFFLRKWYVSIISSMHKVHSPLLLALLGKQNTGKTEFFRRLLPPELLSYYAESKLDKGKDDELLMTENILIMDDELGGKSKQESKKLNNITSVQWFSVRRPYGDHNEKINRLAVLCGTSNYMEILSDPTGNRRIIPVKVDNINKLLYNSIDKGLLLKEAYRLYKEGFDWRISGENIAYLNNNETEHQMIIKERELIQAYFEPCNPGEPGELRMSTTDILVDIELLTRQKLNINTVGSELLRMGYSKKTTRLDAVRTPRLWVLKKKNRVVGGGYTPPTEEEKNYF